MMLIIVALVVLLGTACRAEVAEGAISPLTTIQDAEGHSRILFDLAFPVSGDRIAIRRALLRFPVLGSSENRELVLRIYPVTTPWIAGAAEWNAGWASPGGDYSEGLFARAIIDLSTIPGEAVIDLTGIVKEVIEDDFPAYGFLVTVDPGDGVGLNADDLGRLAGIANATVDFSYRRVPPTPLTIATGDTVQAH